MTFKRRIAQLTVSRMIAGRSVKVVLHHVHAADERRGRAEIRPKKERKEIVVDPKLFDGYIGRFELAPNFILAVTREGNQLFVQATGQPKFPVFPETARDYFLKVVDAQVTFNTDGQGRATELILHQNGMNQPAKRVE